MNNLDKPLSNDVLRAIGFKRRKGVWVLFGNDKERQGRGLEQITLTRNVTMYELLLHVDERAGIRGWDAAMRRTAQFAGEQKKRGSPIHL